MKEIILFEVDAVYKSEPNVHHIRYVVLGDWFGESDWHNEIATKLGTTNWISFKDQCAIVGDYTLPNYNQGVRDCEIIVLQIFKAWIVNSQNYKEIISTIKENP